MPDTSPHLLPAGTWTPDPARSLIGFSAGAHRGRLDDCELRLVVADDGGAALGATVHGARFETTAIRRDGDLLELDGEVTLNGRTLAVTACGTVTVQDGALVVDTGTVVDRRQFGIEAGIGPEVAIDVHLTLLKEPQ